MATPLDEDLTRHAGALRGLAVNLVGANDAGDLVQEVSLTALEQGPRDHSAVGSWLRAVLRNKAYKKHRGDTRRQGREQTAHERAAKDSAPAAIDVAAHRETISRLHSALLALPSPYQDTLFARYFEDLTPTDIAVRMNTSVATVKSRLRRGHEQLRGQLESSSGPDWRGGLVAAFGLGKTTTTAAPAVAILTTMTILKLLGATAATTLLLWFLWPDPITPTSNASAVEESGVVAATSAPVASTETPRQPAEVAAAPTAKRLPASEGVTVVGRCVDHAGKPLGGVLAEGQVYGLNGEGVTETLTATSGEDGSFEVALPILEHHGHGLKLTLVDHCDVEGTFFRAKKADRIELGDIVIPTACAVHGSVVDRSGEPQSNVLLELRPIDSVDALVRPVVGHRRMSSGLDGRFTMEGVLPPGKYTAWLLNRKELSGTDLKFTISLEQRHRTLELQVSAPPAPCRGTVVDEHGTAIAGAGVSLSGGRYSPFAEADSNGRFSIRPDPHQVTPYYIDASASGYRGNRADWSPDSEQPLRIVLTRMPGMRLQVVDAESNQPVTGYAGWLLRPTSQSNVPSIKAGEHPGGTAILSSDAGQFFVVVDPTDTRHTRSQMVPVTIPKKGNAQLTVRLTKELERQLIVLADGKPIADATVELVDCGGVAPSLKTEVWPLGKCRVYGTQVGCLLQTGTTATDGTLQLRGPAGPLCLRITGAGLARQYVQPIRLDEPGDLVVHAARGAMIHGTIKPLSVVKKLWQRQQKEVHGSHARSGLELRQPDGTPLDQNFATTHTINEDGTFVFAGVPAGTWDLVYSGKVTFALATIALQEGESVHRAFDASVLVPVTAKLRLTLDGAPLPTNARYYGVHEQDVRGKHFRSNGKIKKGAAGRATITTWPGELLFELPWRDAAGTWHTLRAGVRVPQEPTNELLVDVRTGTLNIQCVDATGKPTQGAVMRLAYSPFVPATQYEADESGSLSVALGQGTYNLSVLPQRLSTREAQRQLLARDGFGSIEKAWLPVTEVTVTGNTGPAQTIHLPPAWQH